ncbi:DUF559 domain-containing protein [Catellatospora coxensis]|uniref:DUF559 domain-containing protein n=1 Tax=Catellatospora coxensis TaxID=310354 RepID=A0A8J3L0U6_9ACTN|nr:DUF559 domain-containing protein [Catellatospora coxensis]GIG05680.1 hypothetical protein Cco03nite_23800 [Catellatospora coxensis]
MADRVRAVDLVDAIAETLSQVKSYELPEVGERFGLAPGDGDEAFASKKWYVRKRINRWDLHQLVSLAVRVLEEYRSDQLQDLVQRASVRGVDGDFKNLIFAAKGPKPELVLRDAVSNEVEIVKHAEYCLIYRRVLPPDGLSWAALVRWWCEDVQGHPSDDLVHPARLLYQRLFESLDPKSPPEQLFFQEYCALYRQHPFDRVPALIPQVYLHFDPLTRRQRAQPGPLVRQRMDFLLLLPHGQRVVIEIDGRQHYSTDDGRADARRYAKMVAEDRRLRLAGYEVFRFGGHELTGDEGTARQLVQAFIADLFEQYGVLS